MKKGIIAATALVGIAGGFIFAQGALFSSAEAQITAAEAKKLALQEFDGKIVEFDFDHDDRIPHYEFDIKNGSEKAEVEVEADSGKVIITEVESVEKLDDKVNNTSTDTNTPENQISKAEAIKIANTVATGTVVKVELDADDSRLSYDIELRDGNIEYDVEIDAHTGQVIEFERDED
ncbi:MAG: PepSY domain-containing protein [Lysinibacillus sp.]